MRRHPGNRSIRAASQAGLPVPALPFAQRIKMLAEASPRAKLQCIEEGEQPIPGLQSPPFCPLNGLTLASAASVNARRACKDLSYLD